MMPPGVPRMESDDLYAAANHTFDCQWKHVHNCDIIVVSLSHFHG